MRNGWAAAIALAALGAGFALASAGDPPGDGARTGEEVAALRAELAAERAAREGLEARLARLEADLSALGAGPPDAAPEPLAEASGAAPGQPEVAADHVAALEAPGSERGWFDAARLEAAGLPDRDVADLRRLFEETELERLYLRDQATRERWPQARLASELAALDERMTSVREDYGENAYDWFLYAAGRPNRVKVEGVLGGSAAAEAGLRAGDLIYAYGGERVFRPFALVRSTQSGRLGETIELEVERGAERLRLTVPRGPLGIRLGRDTLEPPPVR